MRALVLIFALTACTEASHLGNPLLLPVTGVSTAFENAGYKVRRDRVKHYLVSHQHALRAENFNGPHMAALFDIARTPQDVRPKVIAEMPEHEHPDWAERATVIVMVHS